MRKMYFYSDDIAQVAYNNNTTSSLMKHSKAEMLIAPINAAVEQMQAEWGNSFEFVDYSEDEAISVLKEKIRGEVSKQYHDEYRLN